MARPLIEPLRSDFDDDEEFENAMIGFDMAVDRAIEARRDRDDYWDRRL